MNPYTPIRRDLGRLRAVVEEMYQDALREELAHVGARLEVVVESTPAPMPAFNAAALAATRRGRPRKIEAPPLQPSTLTICTPDPDGAALLESLAPASSPQGNANGTRVKKIYPWERL